MPSMIIKKRKRGFTLIELITSIFILTILASIMVPNMRRAFYKAKLTGCQGNLRSLATAIKLYTTDHKEFPDSLNQLTPDYIIKIPDCPGAEEDTYSRGYVVERHPDVFTIYCSGLNHDLIDMNENEPYYSPSQGIGP